VSISALLSISVSVSVSVSVFIPMSVPGLMSMSLSRATLAYKVLSGTRVSDVFSSTTNSLIQPLQEGRYGKPGRLSLFKNTY